MIDETGKRYGRWFVLERGTEKFNFAYWICKCDCGAIKTVIGMNLRNGSSKSCGCLQRKHGPSIDNKRCGKCGLVKPVNQFFKRSDGCGGIHAIRSRCIPCCSIKTMDARIALRLRNQLNKALKGQRKFGRAQELLGCSIENFRIYIESKFDTGMLWSNYGTVWHIDHVMPCAVFDLSKQSHQKRCFHFSNMQPLFASENIRKGMKVLSDQFNLF